MDNGAHLHLLVNHFPIIGAFLAIPMLVLTLLLRRERGLLLASVFLLVVTAASGWASQWTGEKAETMFDNNENKEWYEPYSEADISEHEQRAKNAMWFAVPTALLGVGVLVMAHRRKPEDPLPWPWIAVLLAGAGLTATGMAYVGNAGGVIMHREIRGDSLDTVKPKEHAEKESPK